MSRILSPQQVQFFHDNGYLIVEDVIPQAVLWAIYQEYSQRLDEIAHSFHDQGLLQSTYAELPFGERYVRMLYECPQIFDFLEISLPLVNEDMPANIEMHHGPAVFQLLTQPDLLDVVESILGPEIYSNPVQHLRIKPPQAQVPAAMQDNSYVATTTWHQDQGALLDEADHTRLLTVWVAMTDATEENGCLVCIPGSHKKDGGALTVHCPGATISAENFIPQSLLRGENILSMPVGRGGVVLLHQFTEHSALPNRTSDIRWSFDLRYNITGQPTGRPAFPGFVARSRSQPDSELRDPVAWGKMWEQAYNRILQGQAGPIYNQARWTVYADSPVCA